MFHTRPRSPLRFQRRNLSVGERRLASFSDGRPLAALGAEAGPVSAVIGGLNKVVGALADRQFEQEAQQVQKDAAGKGVAEARSALAEDRPLTLMEGDTVAAQVFNRSVQQGYFEHLDLNADAAIGQLEREVPDDPQAFGERFDATFAKLRRNMPADWHDAFDLEVQRRRQGAVGRVAERAIRRAAGEANAVHIAAATSYAGESWNALRTGDAETAAKKAAKFNAALDARTDLTAQQKEKARLGFEMDSRRHAVLGAFDQALSGGPEAASRFIDSVRASDAIANPDERGAVVKEMEGVLKDRLHLQDSVRREAEVKAKAARAGRFAAVDLAISRGQYGYGDLERDNAAGLFGKDPAKYAEFSKALDKRGEDERKIQARLGLVAAAKSGETVLDPKNAEHRKAVDEDFARAVAPAMQGQAPADVLQGAADHVRRVGMVPTPVKGYVRGALRAGDPLQAAAAADLLGRIEAAAPAASLDDFGKADRALAHTVNQLVGAGVDPVAAVERARERVNPENKAVADARLKAITDEKMPDKFAGWLKDHFNPTSGLDFLPWGPSDDAGLGDGAVKAQATADFAAVFRDWFVRTGDADIARTLALKDISRVWGSTSADGSLRVMKYPPEAFYGVQASGRAGGTDADGEWLRAQLLEDVKAAGARPDIKDGDVVIEADARTAREASNGKPTWAVFVRNRDGVFEPLLMPTAQDGDLENATPFARWAPDPSRPAQASAEKALAEGKRKRALASADDKRFGPAPAYPWQTDGKGY